jgi:hypothetical protein
LPRQGEVLAQREAIKLLERLGRPEPPTPLASALDLHDLSQHFVSKQMELPLPDVTSYVRGVLDAPEKCIYVIEDKHVRRRFVSAHEIGHYVIPEHNALLQICNTWDLRADVRKELEREANAFAAALLSQGGRFCEECLQSDFSLEMLRRQCDRYEISYEAGMRRFVEGHDRPIALAVCKPFATQSGAKANAAVLQYWAASDPYRRGRFPIPETKQRFGPDHFVGNCVQTGAGDYQGELNFTQANVRLPATVFFNSYSVLVLIGPAGQAMSA